MLTGVISRYQKAGHFRMQLPGLYLLKKTGAFNVQLLSPQKTTSDLKQKKLYLEVLFRCEKALRMPS